MRHSVPVFTLLVFFSFTARAQFALSKPRVDQRVELLSIVFRLAGNKEYDKDENVNYIKKIHDHFDRFRGHPLIRYAKLMHDSNGVSYDAVMSMAIHLTPGPDLQPIIPFTTATPGKKWGKTNGQIFVGLLRSFYMEADCRSFFDSCASDYAIAENRFNILFKKLDVSWYPRYYGVPPTESFNIVIGLGNGGNNYGPHISMPDGTKKVYAIIGAGSFDSLGLPVFESPIYLSTLVHEFNHSFVNHLTETYEKLLSIAGDSIFRKMQAKMEAQAYMTWETMISEALVRASVVRYLISHDHDRKVADKELKEQLNNGFIWLGPLVKQLEIYEKERQRYPTLESYIPRLAAFYETVAPKINSYQEAYTKNLAEVVSVGPFVSNDTLVDPKTNEILFNFNKPLDGERYFFGPTSKGLEHYPKAPHFLFRNGNKTIVIKADLKPGTEYQINMIGRLMRAADGYAVKPYVLSFKTNKE
jgi:hypothetical protein